MTRAKSPVQPLLAKAGFAPILHYGKFTVVGEMVKVYYFRHMKIILF
ncbi:hypothetical protein LEP1GSC018_0981 [Leptospira kirschneri str. 2008720114]|nr:hypothetical protein LEP1GSC018_0981 [Leptospira kirschneri str. 2008720114]